MNEIIKSRLSKATANPIKFLIGAAILFFVVASLNGCHSPDDGTVAPNAAPKIEASPVRVSAPDANASEPALAADESANLYAVYVQHEADQTADVFLQKFDANGNTVGEKVRVNREKGRARAWFGDPPTVQIGRDRTIYVGWTARFGNEKSNANILYLSVSRDGGASFGAPVKVNDDTAPAAHGMHSLALGSDDRVYMAWLDERNVKTAARSEENAPGENQFSVAAEPQFQFVKAHHNSKGKTETKIEKPAAKVEAAEPNSEIFYAVSNDGGRTFAANRKIAGDVCPCCKTHLLAAPDGKIYASWRQVLPGDYRHIAVASIETGAANFSAPVIVADDRWQISACPVAGASLMMSAEKNLTVAWFTAGAAGAPGIYAATSKDGGKTFAPRALIGANAVGGTPVLLGGATSAAAIFAEAGEIARADWQTDAAAAEKNRREIGAGDSPAAVVTDKRIFIAFVKKETARNGVWLVGADK